MIQQDCLLTAVTWSTALIIQSNSLGQCLKYGTISLRQSLIYMDKLKRSVGLCLKYKRPCENIHFFENRKGSRWGGGEGSSNLFSKFKVVYIILTDTWLRTSDMNKGNITNIIPILKQYYSDIWTLWKGLDVQNEDDLLPRLQKWR